MTDPIYNAINALDDISNGKKVNNKQTMSEDGTKDITNILNQFDTLTEGRATQEARKVPEASQLPSGFKPKNISPVIGEPEKDHPTKGYFVGGESEYGNGDSSEAVKDAILGRITRQHLDLINNHGLDSVMDEVDSVASMMGDVDEIGSSDVSGWVKSIKDNLERSDGTQTQEDVVSDQPMQLGDYLDSLASTVNKDTELKNAGMAKTDPGKVGPSVKTYTTDDGQEIKIHGNEDDGFRISIKGKPAKSTFSELDEAAKACEAYVSRKSKASGYKGKR